jgi:AcrR family transcriptional regulator
MPASHDATARRTQAERRSATRAALLEATIACLVELGYTRTTTTEVVRRAGVSQGALFKHFPTKSELVAAATTQLFDDLIDDFSRAFDTAAKHEEPVVVAIRRLWKVFCAPELGAVYRLYVEAPFDDELRAALVPVMARHEARITEKAKELFPSLKATPEAMTLFATMLFAMQGMSLPRPVRPTPEKERLVLAQFEALARAFFAGHGVPHAPTTNPRKPIRRAAGTHASPRKRAPGAADA